MKYCPRCGAQLQNEDSRCYNCGAYLAPDKNATLQTVIKIFLIVGCVAEGWLILPLAWCLPITISIFNSFKNGEKISTGMKVCTLIFVNIVAGVCLLVSDDI